jgi:phospho-N-acetylmuramoyl-pentapeptide-transferase
MIPWLMELTYNLQVQWGLRWGLQIFDQESFRVLAAALLAFMLVMLSGKRVIAWLRRMKIGDTGQTDALALAAKARDKANTPTMGGILIVGAILIAAVLLADLRNFYVQLGLVVMLWLAGLGAVDDWLKLTAKMRKTGSRQGLYSWEKFVFQVGMSLLVGYFAYQHGVPSNLPGPYVAHVLTLPFQKTYEPGTGELAAGLVFLPLVLYLVMSVLMVTGMSNAANIADGMDGLCAGVSAIIAIGLVVLVFIAGEQQFSQSLLVPHVANSGELAVLVAAMGGACLGFLWFNCYPASVFMGDTGSLALGGLIGYSALIIRQEVLVILMAGIFIWEILTVIMQVGFFKMTGGRRIFKCAPYHHHLHLSDWTEQQIVSRFWIITVLAVIIALVSIKVR